MGYYVPKEKPTCHNCPFRTGNYCGILTENEGVKEYVYSYGENPLCPLVDAKDLGKFVESLENRQSLNE